MKDFLNNLKNFEYDGKIIYYNVKDINIGLKPVRGVEMATAYMDIFNEQHNHLDVFQIKDEKLRVLYAMPYDAKKWYEDYLNKK